MLPDLKIEGNVFGSTLKCVQKYVIDNYGKEKWRSLLIKSGLPPDKVYHSISFYPDIEFEQLLKVCSLEFRTSQLALMRQFGKAFGTYLIGVYGRMFLKEWRSLDIIEKIAPKVFNSIQFVDPYTPSSSVTCEKIAPDEVVVHYQSPRRMCVYLFGIIDAVGEHFKENLEITQPKCMHSNDPECEIHVKLLNSPANLS